MSVISWFMPKGLSGFGYGSTAESVTEGLDLTGKNILVTGCNSGIGEETARVLAMRGARVLGTARTVEKAREALAKMQGATTPFACELADPASVRACVEAIRKDGAQLDAIICNAGIMALPKRETAFGTELQFFTNHVGHFQLVTGLLDRLSDTGRVVMLSSSAHKSAPKAGIEFDNLSGERGYRPWTAYGQSKFANVLFAKELARKFAGTKKTANAVHPGVIRTKLGRHMPAAADLAFAIGGPLFLKSIAEGAATTCYVAVHPGAANLSGKYFADCNVASPRSDSEDPQLAKQLWTETEQLLARVA